VIKADLHIHTNYSDGLFSPEQIFKLAESSALNIISFTDHDCINSQEISVNMSSKFNIEYIPGVEFSTTFNNSEVHILGYFLDFKDIFLDGFLKSIKYSRTVRISKIIDKLRKNGVRISLDDVCENQKKEIPLGRPHIASVLIKTGYSKSYQDAFTKYLGDGKSAFVKKENPDLEIVLELIKKLNGISFLAHPGKYFSYETLKKILNSGVDGIEVFHPSHSRNDTNSFIKIANENDLLICGGSDFHGLSDSEMKSFGKFYIDSSYVKKMKNFLNLL
jgi:3',5'-nucleoside bisphosphate phosphatase